MLVDLYLLKNYNNYFNKKVKKKDTLNAYLGAVASSFKLESTNFNPNDGISTSHVIGSANSPFEPSEGESPWTPDYVLVVNSETDEIISRWFVTESTRNMANQYTIQIKRDVIADFYEVCINSPCYVEKGHLEEDDPFIVNNEGISFNQKKTKEYFLKDETKVPWVVVYLNQHERETKLIKSKFSSPNIIEIENAPELLALFPNITSATTDQKITHKVLDDNSISLDLKYLFNEWVVPFPVVYWRRGEVRINLTPTSSNASLIGVKDTSGLDRYTIFDLPQGTHGLGYVDNGWDNTGVNYITPMKNVCNDIANNMKNDFNNKVAPIFNAMGCTHHSTGYVEPDVKKYIGKIIHVNATGKYFIFDIKDNGSIIYDSDNDGMKDNVISSFNAVTHSSWISLNDRTIRARANTSSYKSFVMSLNSASDVKLNLIGTRTGETPDNGYQTQLEPYDIICFPAFTTQMTKTDGTKMEAIGSAGINIARAMSEQLGTDVLYDVQVLPYCPCRELIGSDGDIDIRLANTNQAMPITDNSDNVVSYALVSTFPFHAFDIQTLGLSIYNDDEVLCSSELSVDNRKIVSNTDMYRLSSPNYASSFEFNLAKCVPINRPEITKFKVDIDFRPYNPYIHIAPDFAFLYGGDFNDSRGLICSGDFGLTTMRNAWTDYQVRNKNYQNIFNREINHMEVERGFQREAEAWNIGTSFAKLGTAVGGGAIAGGLKGGIGGAIAGGITGGGLGALNIASKFAEMNRAERRFKENVSYTTDMFNMQMDNIKALPNTITHSASLTNNFKFYPVLEYYTCTPEEKSAFENKLKYNGMTIGRIDIINNYLSDTEERFIKGQMIRLENLSEDSHIAMEIYNEINSGVFFAPKGE